MSAKSELINKLKSNKKTRESYVRAKLNVNLPSQIRSLRLKREMKQEDLAREAEMMQPRISAMERPGATKFNLETLIRLAAAFRVGLVVKFVTFSEMLKWENEFGQDTFNVVKIDDDVEFHKEEQEQPAAQAAELSTKVASSFPHEQGAIRAKSMMRQMIDEYHRQQAEIRNSAAAPQEKIIEEAGRTVATGVGQVITPPMQQGLDKGIIRAFYYDPSQANPTIVEIIDTATTKVGLPLGSSQSKSFGEESEYTQKLLRGTNKPAVRHLWRDNNPTPLGGI